MGMLDLNKDIISCKKCPRLLNWASSRLGKNPRYSSCSYWGKPVTGFGDSQGRLLIVGLAPGAHGANRTGRPFTGDKAGDYLYRALFRFGYSSNEVSTNRHDGLILKDTFVTNVVRCAPPEDKPQQTEFIKCRHFLRREMSELPNIKTILVLGEKAFNQIKIILKECGANTCSIKFQHGAIYRFGNNLPSLIVSYHTSQRNINSNKMSDETLEKIFQKVTLELLNSPIV